MSDKKTVMGTRKKKKIATKTTRTNKKTKGNAVVKKAPSSKKKTALKEKGTTRKKVAKKKKLATRKGQPATKKTPSSLSSSSLSAHGDLQDGAFIPYQETADEEYMGAQQLEHFRKILLNWKQELMEEVARTVAHMRMEGENFSDPADRATQEEEFGLELRTRDRERKLLKKINAALLRIEDGSYGYCEETGEPIGIRRLEARPVATLSLEAQQRREIAKRQFRDKDDHDR